MAKKRKTRAQKIITQLRKELERQKKQQLSSQPQVNQKNQEKSTETKIKYSFTAKNVSGLKTKYSPKKQTQAAPIAFNPILIKYDLLKTLYLSVAFFVLIGYVYWYLELGGEKIIRGFFHL